jgi:hypothetical protein
MSNYTINYGPTSNTNIDFTIARVDGVALTNYTLYNHSVAISQGSFQGSYFIPTNTLIKFTPVFRNLSPDNRIIQCEWKFGDGEKLFVSFDESEINHFYHVGTDKSVTHTYSLFVDSATENNPSKNACMTVSLTAVDRYQKIYNCQKIVYPKNISS